MGRRRNGAADFINSFAAGYGATSKVINDYDAAKVRADIGRVEQDFTPRETEAVSGQDALNAGRQAYDAALANATTDEQRAQIAQQYAPTLRALEADSSRPASIIKSIGVGGAFQQRDGSDFTRSEIDSAKAQERARIYEASGHTEDAARTLNNATRSRALADQDELRTALGLRPGETTRNEGMRTSIGTGADITGASSVPLHTDAPAAEQATTTPSATPPASAGAPASPTNPAANGVRKVQGFRDPLEHYLAEVAPRAVNMLVRQGHIETAKQYSDFLESQQGLQYAKLYSGAVRKYAIGDHQGALADFENLYNRDDLFPDGRNVKLTALDGGQMRVDQLDSSGNIVATRTGKISDLTEQAALALNPVAAVQFMAKEKAKRDSEAAVLDRQIQLEDLRQTGRQDQEDRRDERLQLRLDAQGRALERRLEAQGGRGRLTAAQERSNAEIDAARERIAGLDPAEIRRRTLKQTETGRENPDFDGSLAKAASLAARRKIGEDDAFDSRQNTPKAPAFDIEDVRKRFRGDRSMDSHRLGNATPNGVEVIDKSGRVIGHYR